MLGIFKKEDEDYRKYKPLRGSIIILEGNIGAGKTTLGKLLAKYLNSIGLKAIFFEEYRNPTFLNEYIKDMKRYAFSFQSIIARERVRIYERADDFASTGGIAIIDRGLIGDMVFATMQKNKGFFTDIDWKIYINLATTSRIEPSHVLYLKVEPIISFQRMMKRDHKEESSYTLEYFQEVHKTYESTIDNIKKNKLILDWSKNIKSLDYNVCKYVLNMLLNV